MNERIFLGEGDVEDAFAACGIGAGDLVFLHSDAMVAAQFPPMEPAARYDVLIDALLARLGPAGTLVIPTFTESFARSEPFDVERRDPRQLADVALYQGLDVAPVPRCATSRLLPRQRRRVAAGDDALRQLVTHPHAGPDRRKTSPSPWHGWNMR